MNFVICKRNRLQTYLLTNLIINLMVLVDKENVKGYVQKVKKEEIIKEANKNIEIFKRFQEAARLNPNLTYAEFIKTLN